MKHLHVFNDVPIPVDYASTQTYALLAKRDGGKTYTTLLFEEQLCDAGLFFVTLDPVGKHWALRAGPNGSPTGGKPGVWVLGGLHGDVPLEPTSGALIADVVVDHPGQYVLDVSTFDTDADQDRFALAFAQRLFRRKAKDPGFPMTLILEEAEAFIPERYSTGQAKMLGAFGRIMRQGRNHGLGMWMVAQRAQALNKGVLSQAEVLVVKQMAHPRDLDAVEAWVKANGTPEERKEMMESVASLEQNEAYVWSPSWLRVFARTKVPKRVTFDSSASIKGGQEMKKVELVPLDVEALGKSIAQTAERVKADDPKELRKRIRELERQLAERPAEQKTVEVPVEVEVISPAVVEAVFQFNSNIENEIRPISDFLESIVRRSHAVLDVVRNTKTAQPVERPSTGRARVPESAPWSRVAPPRSVANRSSGPAAQNGHVPDDITRPQLKLLNALATLREIGVPSPSKSQLALVAGVRPTSGGYFNNLSRLRSSGLIDYPAPATAALTEAGDRIAVADSIQTNEELHDMVRGLVSGPQWSILEKLIEIYPDQIEKEALAEQIGVSPTSGGYFNNLSKLRTLGLIDYPTRGSAAATSILFMEA